MPAEKFKTTMVPFEIKEIHNGVNKTTQREFTIWQVRARNTQGQEIVNYPLRSFEKLPLNEPLEVECQLYDGGSYGLSYTVKLLSKTDAREARLEALEALVANLYAHLGLAMPGGTQPPARPPAPAAAPAPGPPPPRASADSGQSATPPSARPPTPVQVQPPVTSA